MRSWISFCLFGATFSVGRCQMCELSRGARLIEKSERVESMVPTCQLIRDTRREVDLLGGVPGLVFHHRPIGPATSEADCCSVCTFDNLDGHHCFAYHFDLEKGVCYTTSVNIDHGRIMQLPPSGGRSVAAAVTGPAHGSRLSCRVERRLVGTLVAGFTGKLIPQTHFKGGMLGAELTREEGGCCRACEEEPTCAAYEFHSRFRYGVQGADSPMCFLILRHHLLDAHGRSRDLTVHHVPAKGDATVTTGFLMGRSVPVPCLWDVWRDSRPRDCCGHSPSQGTSCRAQVLGPLNGGQCPGAGENPGPACIAEECEDFRLAHEPAPRPPPPPSPTSMWSAPVLLYVVFHAKIPAPQCHTRSRGSGRSLLGWVGSAVGIHEGHGASEADCCLLCLRAHGCRGYEHATHSASCWLFFQDGLSLGSRYEVGGSAHGAPQLGGAEAVEAMGEAKAGHTWAFVHRPPDGHEDPNSFVQVGRQEKYWRYTGFAGTLLVVLEWQSVRITMEGQCARACVGWAADPHSGQRESCVGYEWERLQRRCHLIFPQHLAHHAHGSAGLAREFDGAWTTSLMPRASFPCVWEPWAPASQPDCCARLHSTHEFRRLLLPAVGGGPCEGLASAERRGDLVLQQRRRHLDCTGRTHHCATHPPPTRPPPPPPTWRPPPTWPPPPPPTPPTWRPSYTWPPLPPHTRPPPPPPPTWPPATHRPYTFYPLPRWTTQRPRPYPYPIHTTTPRPRTVVRTRIVYVHVTMPYQPPATSPRPYPPFWPTRPPYGVGAHMQYTTPTPHRTISSWWDRSWQRLDWFHRYTTTPRPWTHPPLVPYVRTALPPPPPPTPLDEVGRLGGLGPLPPGGSPYPTLPHDPNVRIVYVQVPYQHSATKKENPFKWGRPVLKTSPHIGSYSASHDQSLHGK